MSPSSSRAVRRSRTRRTSGLASRISSDPAFPNLLSFARLLGVPVFLWLVLVPQADVWAFVLLAVAGRRPTGSTATSPGH